VNYFTAIFHFNHGRYRLSFLVPFDFFRGFPRSNQFICHPQRYFLITEKIVIQFFWGQTFYLRRRRPLWRFSIYFFPFSTHNFIILYLLLSKTAFGVGVDIKGLFELLG